jgi:hypothetical protein
MQKMGGKMSENIKVTLHLTPEAAHILHQYAGDRNRGYFVSQMLLEQRRRDDLESEVIAALAKEQAAKQVAEAVRDAREKFHLGGNRSKKRR